MLNLKAKLETTLSDARSTLENRKMALEDRRKALESRIEELRGEWKNALVKGMDKAFCAAMETIESAISLIASMIKKPDLITIEWVSEDKPVFDAGDWIQ